MEVPILTQFKVWNITPVISDGLNNKYKSGASTTLVNDIMVDNKPSEICKHTELVTQEEIPTVFPTAAHKLDPLHSLNQQKSELAEDLSSSPGSVLASCHQYEQVSDDGSSVITGEGPSRRERFTSDRQQVSQEITILVTNHDSDLELGEVESIESYTNPQSVTSAECTVLPEEDNLDGSEVVADLIELSQQQQISSSSEQNISLDKHDLIEPGRDINTEETQHSTHAQKFETKYTKVSGESAYADGKCTTAETAVFSEDPERPEKSLCGMVLKQDKSLGNRNAKELLQEMQGQSPGAQQHVQTQVSLETMYHSVATSPMTPPKGSSAFSFPYCLSMLGASGENKALPVVEMKDAELQVGVQVEFRTIATDPMTPVAKNAPDLQLETRSVATAPMTPVARKAPVLQVETQSVATGPMTPVSKYAPDLQVETRSVATAPMTPVIKDAPNLQVETRSVATTPMTPVVKNAPELQIKTESIATGPMTPIASTAPDLQVETRSVATAPMTPLATAAPDLQLETVSVATAPMTPIAATAPELQVRTHSVSTAPMTPIATTAPELQVETRSVATAPMTPIATTAPELRIETRSVATAPMTPIAKSAPELQVETCSVATTPMTPISTNAPELQVETRSVATAPMTPIATTAPELQVETRSVATAPMTPIATSAPEQLVETRSVATAPMTPIATTAPQLLVETRSVATAPMTPIATTAPELLIETRSVATAPMTPVATTAPELQVETRSVATAPMTPIATAAPELCVETRSVATAPMTPIATTAPELSVETHTVGTGPMTPITTTAPELCVETRSVATDPMTPIARTAPELQLDQNFMVHSIATSPIVLNSPELIPEPEPRVQTGREEHPEPVQEVRWDEKGMTWEVYGAVVEVAILGSAIQKHLEKQVKKHRKPPEAEPNLTSPLNTADSQTPLPSSPPATAPSSRCSSAKGSRKKEGKGTRGRRTLNPIRTFFRNVRRPSCCSRTHSEERQ